MSEFLDRLVSPVATAAFVTAGLVVYTYLALRFVRLTRRHPSSFTVAVLGFPHSGKTVFVTTLFDELQQGKSRGLRVSPYGAETVEEVGRNLNMLARGQWLPRTTRGNVFFFRAIAAPTTSATKRVRLEIADFAGEDLGELQPSEERWLHKGDYFKYVIDADAIFLAIDGEAFLAAIPNAIEEVANAFIACVQIVADAHGAVGSRKLREPVALLVMKADLLNDDARARVEDQLARLDAVCKTRCRHYQMFFVSSTGPLNDKMPPIRRAPSHVLEPLEWALRQGASVDLGDVVRQVLFLGRPRTAERWTNRNE